MHPISKRLLGAAGSLSEPRRSQYGTTDIRPLPPDQSAFALSMKTKHSIIGFVGFVFCRSAKEERCLGAAVVRPLFALRGLVCVADAVI